jgi:hypothetical protein
MRVTEIKKHHVKKWVVKYATVTNPYGKASWFASVTIGYDYNGEGTSIEKAYCALVDHILKTPFIMIQLSGYKTFKDILYAE